MRPRAPRKRHPRRASIAAALALAWFPAHAQDPPPAADDETHERLKRDVRQYLANVEPRWYVLSRARAVHPQRIGIGVGAIRTRLPGDFDCRTACELKGWFVAAEPGLSGHQVGAGYAWLKAETRQPDRWVRTVFVGYGLRGVVLRTRDDAWTVREQATWAGLEGNFTIVRVNLSVGVLRRASGGDGDDWVYTGGIGWGF